MNKCACGCGQDVARKWALGHNRLGIPPTNKRGWTEDSRGYRFVYVPDHPQAKRNGYHAEHRLVVEKRLGRFLLNSEDVHHINGIRSDNRDENLEVMTHGGHAGMHTRIAKFCMDCGGKHRSRGLCASCYAKYERREKQMPLAPTHGGRKVKIKGVLNGC